MDGMPPDAADGVPFLHLITNPRKELPSSQLPALPPGSCKPHLKEPR